ncbi:MAG: lipopolysaccharide biosynthesis protein [Candidatus Cloacimonetes bacterium]|nr:lipopolysaccharide biosynthesis protein [Candidatus Cloacimonadota bacterium]
MPSLRNKAISGASWSLTGRLLRQGVNFIVGILLARLLLPEQYGLVGMATVFIYILFTFVDSGFNYALIQKSECTQADYSTVFYINFVISLIAFIILYNSAPWISEFYNEPKLIKLVRVLSIVVILMAFTLVQRSIIIREVNYRLLARIEFFSQLLSGVIGIILAYTNFGVWALVWKILLNQLFINIQLWLMNKWKPSLVFSKNSFNQLFGFGSKILFSGILQRIYIESYKLVVGKVYSSHELGLFTRADQFQKLPSSTVNNSILSVVFPIFSKMQNDPKRFKQALIKTISIVMFYNFNAMVLLAIIAKPLIQVLLGEKWIGVIEYLQLLCAVGLFVPLQGLIMQTFSSKGKSGMYLINEIINKLLMIPAIFLGVLFSIKSMIFGMIISTLVSLFINIYYVNKLIDFKVRELLKILFPSLRVVTLMGTVSLLMSHYFTDLVSPTILLILLILVSLICIVLFSILLKVEAFFEIKKIIKEKILVKLILKNP